MNTIKLVSIWLLFPVFLGSCAGAAGKHTANPPKAETGKTIIVDVRTPEEWNNDGHAGCSVNYPLDELSTKIDILKAYDTVILVCRSGNRAAIAKTLLEKAGLQQVENKGAWQHIDCR